MAKQLKQVVRQEPQKARVKVKIGLGWVALVVSIFSFSVSFIPHTGFFIGFAALVVCYVCRQKTKGKGSLQGALSLAGIGVSLAAVGLGGFISLVWLFKDNLKPLERNERVVQEEQPELTPKPEPEEHDPSKGIRGAGYKFAEMYVKPFLKSPSTATFPWSTVVWSEQPSLRAKDYTVYDRYIVKGAVDAQNAFGATVRSRWSVIVIHSDGQYYAGEVYLDGELIYQTSGYRELIGK